jgi:uncharacterized protein (DUF2235 family)
VANVQLIHTVGFDANTRIEIQRITQIKKKIIFLPSLKYHVCEAPMSLEQNYALTFAVITEPETANL